MVPIAWRLPGARQAARETIIASLGSVEIRRVTSGYVVATCVNGEADQACQTGLQRLASYLNGDNRDRNVMRAELPVIQRQVGPRRWQISIRLQGIDGSAAAPAPCAPKVKLLSAPSELLAVVRLPGRKAQDAVADGDAVLLDVVASSEWIVVGPPVLRLHAIGAWQQFASGFEVGVPVAARPLRHDVLREPAEAAGQGACIGQPFSRLV